MNTTAPNILKVVKPWDFFVFYGNKIFLFRPKPGVIPTPIYSANKNGDSILLCERDEVSTGYDTFDSAIKAVAESIQCNLVRTEGQTVESAREVMYQFQPIRK